MVNVVVQKQQVEFKQICPAHEDKITAISTFTHHLVTTSLDQKVKLWTFNEQQQFVLQSSYSHSQKVSAMEIVDNSVVIGDINGGLTILQMHGQLQMMTSLDKYHDDQINAISKFNNQIATVSLDKTLKMMDAQQQVQEYKMKQGINCMEVIKNKKEEELMVLGYCDGNVEIYDNQIELYGRIPTHSYQKTAIKVISNMFYNTDDIVNSKLLVGDCSGIVSFWEFDNF